MADFRWTLDEDRFLLAGRARGLTCAQIAATMRGRSAWAVKTRLRRLGKGVRRDRPPTPRGVEPPQTYRFHTTERQETAFAALMAGRVYEDRRLKSGGLA